jgi:hypothetical protein
MQSLTRCGCNALEILDIRVRRVLGLKRVKRGCVSQAARSGLSFANLIHIIILSVFLRL